MKGHLVKSRNYYNPQSHLPPPLLLVQVQHGYTCPGEDGQINFTQMSPEAGFEYLLVFADTFTR